MFEVEARPSPTQGTGLFAHCAVERGLRRKIHVVREITDDAPLRPELGERADHCDYSNGRVVLVGEPDCYLNHSCDPNAWIAYEADGPYLVARRDIAPGEEVTCDYSLNVTGGDSWPCHCGSQRCRGVVTGDFFALPESLQREYRPYLADWFVQAHRERLDAPEH